MPTSIHVSVRIARATGHQSKVVTRKKHRKEGTDDHQQFAMRQHLEASARKVQQTPRSSSPPLVATIFGRESDQATLPSHRGYPVFAS